MVSGTLAGWWKSLIDRHRVSPLSRLQGCTSTPLLRWTVITMWLSVSVLACSSDQSVGQRKRCWLIRGARKQLIDPQSDERSICAESCPSQVCKAASLLPIFKMGTLRHMLHHLYLVIFLLACFVWSLCLLVAALFGINWSKSILLLHLFGLSK